MAIAREEQRGKAMAVPLINSSSRKPEKWNLDGKFEFGGYHQSNSSLCNQEKYNTGNSNSDSVDSDHNCNYYELRSNPKKTCRFSDLENGVSCQECGKVFDTERALFGHMRWHSVKSSSKEVYECKKCVRVFDSVRALSGHMKTHATKSYSCDPEDDCSDRLLDLDSFCPVRRKRSRVFYKNALHSSSFSSLNESVSVGSEISDVAMAAKSLLLLSRGLRDCIWLDSVTEYSDDSSDYFGGGSYCKTEEIVVDDSEASLSSRMVRFRDPEPEIGNNVTGSDDLGSKFTAEMKMSSGSEVSDEQMCNVKVSDEGLDCYPDTKNLDSVKFIGVDKDVYTDGTLSQSLKFKSCKSPSAENAVGHVDDTSEDAGKILTYKRRMPKKFRSSTNMSVSLLSDNEPVKETGTVSLDSMKRKEFKCPTCFKVFSSGQALGGHKRAHFGGFTTDTRAEEAKIVSYQEAGSLFDVNFPVSLLKA